MMCILRKIESYFDLKTPIIWKNVISMFVFHMFAIYGLLLIPSAKILTSIWWLIVGFMADLALSIGAHRLWTHRTYQAKLPMRIALMLCYMMTGQYSLVQWARDHRAHHLYTDSDADPHSAGRGLFYSHVGWLLMKRHPDLKAKGKNVDVSDLYKDPVIRFHERYFFLLTMLVHIIFPSAFAYYIIGDTLKHSIFILFFFRTAISLNLVWCINSLAHYWGDKPYNKDILASQNSVLAFFMVGEGWHNFHHTFPFDYRIGEIGQSYQFGAYVIETCERLGLATKLRTASKKQIQQAIDLNNKKLQEEMANQQDEIMKMEISDKSLK